MQSFLLLPRGDISMYWKLWVTKNKQSFADVLRNRCSWKFCIFHMKTPVLESLFNKVASLRPWGHLFDRTRPVAASETVGDMLKFRTGLSLILRYIRISDFWFKIIDSNLGKNWNKHWKGFFLFFVLNIYINDLHNIQITTDKHNHQIPWHSRETRDQIKIK